MDSNMTLNSERELLLALRRGDLPSERSKEYWSEEEREELRRRFYVEGMGISKCALHFQRSENAIVQQLTVMGLLIPPGFGKQRQKAARRTKCQCPRCLELECPHYDKERGFCQLNNIQ